MVISSENAVTVSVEGKFPIAVCRQCVGSNSILYQFSRRWVHKIGTGIRGKLEEVS